MMIEKLRTIFLRNTSVKATLFKNFMWLATSNVTSRVIKAGLTVYAARALGASGYGVVSYALGLAGFFVFFKNIGVDTILTREVAKKPDERHFYFSTAIVIEAVLLVVTAGLLLFVAPLFSKIPEAIALLPYVAIMLLADDIRDIFVAFFRGNQEMEVEALVVVVGNVAVAVFGFIALLISATPQALVIAYALASLSGMLAATSLVRTFLGGVREHFQKVLVGPILRASLPIVFYGIAGVFMYNVDVIMLGWWHTTQEIGWYSAALKLVGITSIFGSFIGTAAFPVFSRFVHEGDKDRMEYVASNIFKICFLVALPIIVGGIIVRVPLTALVFGPTYSAAAVPFAVLLFSLLANYPVPIFSSIIVAFNEQTTLVGYAVVTSLTNLLVSFFLIRSHGMVGAAISGIIVSFMFTGFMWHKVSTLMRLRLPRAVYKFILSAAVMGLCALFLNHLGVHVLITIALSAAIYFALVEFMGERLLQEARSIFDQGDESR